MKIVLAALASSAALALLAPAPAAAQLSDPPAAPSFASPSPGFRGGFSRFGRHGDSRHDRFGRDFGGGAYIAYDRDYQGDTAWRPDSFNDWWHDRPDRAFPRWTQGPTDCSRRYWAGGAWRC